MDRGRGRRAKYKNYHTFPARQDFYQGGEWESGLCFEVGDERSKRVGIGVRWAVHENCKGAVL